MMRVVPIALMSMFLVACASTDTAELVAENPIQYMNLSNDGQKKLVKEYWVVEKRQEPKYPVNAARKGLSGCVDLIVGINKDGKAGGYKVKKSYPEGVFDKYAAAALTNWKWSATEKNGDKVPVLTTIKLDFRVSGAKNKTEAQKHCGIPHKS